MVGLRDRLADALHATGVLEATLRGRGLLRVPVVTVLTYHHVASPDGGYAFDDAVADATPDEFRRQLGHLRQRCTPIDLDDLLAGLAGERLPPNPLLVTFDDGYRSNLEVAAPILADLRIPAVCFVATDYLDQRRLYWWEAIAYLVKRSPRRQVTLSYPTPRTVVLDAPGAVRELTTVVKATHSLDVDRFVAELAAAGGVAWTRDLERNLCDQLILTWDELRRLRGAGVEIGSHTRSHRVLQTVPDVELAHELAGSRAVIGRELGAPPRAIAYPVGRAIADEPRLTAAVRAAGYRLGFSNATGVNLLRGPRRVGALDLRRIATERGQPDAMFLAQVAVPPLAYRQRLSVIR